MINISRRYAFYDEDRHTIRSTSIFAEGRAGFLPAPDRRQAHGIPKAVSVGIPIAAWALRFIDPLARCRIVSGRLEQQERLGGNLR